MAFDPKTLPPAVYAAFKQGPMAWALVVEKAMGVGIYDLTKLTDIVFYMHYPARIGNPLKAYETDLINKWKAFRTLILPRYNENVARVTKLHAENMATRGQGTWGLGGINWSKVPFE